MRYDSGPTVGRRRTPVTPLCSTALMLAGPGEGRTAVVIGCATGTEVAALLDTGWTVIGIDEDPAVHEAVRAMAGPAAAERLTTVVGGISRVGRLPHVDLVLARAALMGPDRRDVWSQIVEALDSGGYLAARFLEEESTRVLRGWERLSERHVAPEVVEIVARHP